MLLPYILLERTLDITEGTLDYWLPPKNRHILNLEAKDEDSLTIGTDFDALVKEGKYLDAAFARFRFSFLPFSFLLVLSSSFLSSSFLSSLFLFF